MRALIVILFIICAVVLYASFIQKPYVSDGCKYIAGPDGNTYRDCGEGLRRIP